MTLRIAACENSDPTDPIRFLLTSNLFPTVGRDSSQAGDGRWHRHNATMR